MISGWKKVFMKTVEEFSLFINNAKPGIENSDSDLKVSIMMSYLQSKRYENVIEFWFKPSTGIQITKVDVSIDKFTDTIMGDSQTIYSNDQWYLLVGYEGVENDQEWKFDFYVKIDNSQIVCKLEAKCVIN
jgi:hypothetical protein